MTDYVYKGRLQALNIGFAYGVTTGVANEAVVRHGCDPVAAHALGRALCACILGAAELGTDERLNVRWQYEGALRTLLVDTNHLLETRGFVSPTSLAETADREALFGAMGQIATMISKDGVVLSHGTSEAPLQDVVRDYAFHRAISAQVETALVVMIGFTNVPAAPVRLCRGVCLHALPGCDAVRFDAVRTRLEGDACRALLQRETESDSLFENVLLSAVGDASASPDLHVKACPAPRFLCTCDTERLAAVLRAIPYADRIEMARARQGTSVTCQFCNRRYDLSIDACIRAWNKQPLD